MSPGPDFLMSPGPDFAARRGRLREVLAGLGARAMLVSDLTNIAYLSGFTGSAGALLVHTDPGAGDVLATDARYIDEVAQRAPGLDYLLSRDPVADLGERAARLEGAPWAVLAVEEHVLTVAAHRGLAGRVGALRLVDAGRAVETLRVVKDPVERQALRRACQLSVDALGQVLTEVRVGMSERELAVRLERRMVDLGADAPAFDTIVAAGANSAVPHHAPAEHRLARGELLTIDFGARWGGYHADCTRTVVVGEPAAWQVELHALVAAAQRAGRAALAVGVSAQQVDAAAREVITGAGHGEHFVHGLGHGVGLAVHEAPLLAAGQEGLLRAWTALTIEPGVYLSGRGGVRIEDTVVLTETGPEVLTGAAYELVSVG